jgi:hypothetical protein
LFTAVWTSAAPKEITFSQPASSVESYDFVAVVLASPDARNPFTDVAVRGSFGKAQSAERFRVDGFCDSADGSTFRTLKLESGRYRAEWFSGFTGETVPIGDTEGPVWTSPEAPDHSDWALLRRK